MSSNIGYLKMTTKGTTGELYGEINTLQMYLKIRLMPDRHKSKETSPDYKIYAPKPSGVEVQIGGAWKKTRVSPGEENTEFLSMSIDDPSLSRKLNLHAYKNEQGDWDIIWRRFQEKSAA